MHHSRKTLNRHPSDGSMYSARYDYAVPTSGANEERHRYYKWYAYSNFLTTNIKGFHAFEDWNVQLSAAFFRCEPYSLPLRYVKCISWSCRQSHRLVGTVAAWALVVCVLLPLRR
jgi:hypothetical protein